MVELAFAVFEPGLEQPINLAVNIRVMLLAFSRTKPPLADAIEFTSSSVALEVDKPVGV